MSKSHSVLLGTIAGIFTSGAFLPQVYKIYKTKDTKSLSLSSIIIFTIGQILWVTYGILHKASPIIFFSGLNFILYLYILYAKLHETHESSDVHKHHIVSTT